MLYGHSDLDAAQNNHGHNYLFVYLIDTRATVNAVTWQVIKSETDSVSCNSYSDVTKA